MNDKSHEQAADQGKDVEDDFGGKTGATLEGCASTEGKKMDEVDVPRTSINVKNRNLIRLRGLKQIVPFGTTKLYALIKDRKLPQPIKIGRASFWDADEIHAAVDRLVTEP